MKQLNNRLCLIFNIAPHYRESIYNLIEHTYPCDWYFGTNKTNIKSMDTSSLSNVHILPNYRLFNTNITYRKGLCSLLFKKRYKTFLITGELSNISIWIFLLLSKLFYPNKKTYVWTHGWYGKESRLKRLIKKLYYKLTDGIFLYSNYAKDLMVKEGIDNKKLFVIHNSLQHDEHLKLRNGLKESDILHRHFNNNNKNIIFIGRLTQNKRLDYIIEALSILKHKGYNYNLTLIGDGTEKSKLQKIAQSKDILNNIWFYGTCYDDNINAELIYNADLCVSPGNVGLTAIHTMTFGTPVITHNNFPWQMPEFESIRENTTGAFFNQNDVQSIAQCILIWFENHNDRNAVRLACYKEIDNYWNPTFQINILKQHLQF